MRLQRKTVTSVFVLNMYMIRMFIETSPRAYLSHIRYTNCSVQKFTYTLIGRVLSQQELTLVHSKILGDTANLHFMLKRFTYSKRDRADYHLINKIIVGDANASHIFLLVSETPMFYDIV